MDIPRGAADISEIRCTTMGGGEEREGLRLALTPLHPNILSQVPVEGCRVDLGESSNTLRCILNTASSRCTGEGCRYGEERARYIYRCMSISISRCIVHR